MTSAHASSTPLAFQTPDCILCLRRKLDALGVVAFFEYQGAWYVGDYENDRPSGDSEFLFNYLLQVNVPEIVAGEPLGVVLNTEDEIQAKFPGIGVMFPGCSLIGARTGSAGLEGVRIAWREADRPWSEGDLELLQCFGECPEGCEA